MLSIKDSEWLGSSSAARALGEWGNAWFLVMVSQHRVAVYYMILGKES